MTAGIGKLTGLRPGRRPGGRGVRLLSGIAFAFAALFLACSAQAADLTGTLMGPGGPVQGANLDVFDEATGDEIPLVNDGTDPNGVFLVTVPDNATYEVHFVIPPELRLVSRIVGGVVVTTGTHNMGIVGVEQGALLTGTVVRQVGGTPVVGADTDVVRSDTGETVFTPGDNTDASGVFGVVVPLTTVELAVEPVKLDRLVGILLEGIAVAGDTNVGTLQAEPGALLSGTVVRASNGTPVVGADTDTIDAATGQTIPTAGDNTDDFGVFSVVVPFRDVHVVIEPQKADRLVAHVTPDISIAGDTNIGTIALDGGALLFGHVVRASNGTPVSGADTDADDAFTGASIPTPGDNTDANGDFSVVVPFGTIQFTIEPRKTDRLVAYRKVDLDIAGDTNIGTISLADGFLVSGVASDSGGPAAGVSVAAYLASNGSRVHTPDSTSAADGSFSFILPAGTFDVKWSPPLGQGTARHTELDFSVAGDVVFNPFLQNSSSSVTIGDTGHLVLAGTDYFPVVSFRNNTGAPLDIRATLLGELPARDKVKTILPPVDKTVPASGRIISKSIRVRIPGGLNPQLRGKPLWVRIQVLDPVSEILIDEDFYEFQVR